MMHLKMKLIFNPPLFIYIFVFCFSATARAQIGTDWIKCSDRSVAAERTQFSGYGVTVYKGKTDQLLIIANQGSDRARFCLQILGRWKFIGFREYPQGSAKGKKTVVFAISNDSVDRYFNIKSGEEIFLEQDEDGKTFISYSANAPERIFTR